MKKFILAFLVMLLLFASISFSEEKCWAKLDIKVDFISKIRGTENDSIQQYPYFRETDILWVRYVEITNKGNCDILEPMKLYLSITPREMGASGKQYEFRILPLKKDEMVKISKQNFATYSYEYTNTTKTTSLSGIDLNQVGYWDIDCRIEDIQNENISGYGHNCVINGRDYGWFRVMSLLETLMIEYNNAIIKMNSLVIWLTALLLGLTVALLIYTILLTILGAKTLKSGESQTKEIKKISKYLEKILRQLMRTQKKLKRL